MPKGLSSNGRRVGRYKIDMNICTITNYCNYWGLDYKPFTEYLLKSKVFKSFWVGQETLLIPLTTNPFKIFNLYGLVHNERDKRNSLIQCFKTISGKSRIILKSNSSVKKKIVSKDELWEKHHKFLIKKTNPSMKANVVYSDLTFDNIIWGYPAFWVLDDLETNYKLELHYEMVLYDVLLHLSERMC